MDQKIRITIYLIISGALWVIGGWVISMGYATVRDANASAAWPSVTGKVIAAEVQDQSDDTNSAYSPHVTYRYAVDNHFFTRDTLQFGEDTYINIESAQRVLDGYPIGSEVTVYYDPKDPGRAALRPGTSDGSYLLLVIGIFLIVGAIAIAAPMALKIIRHQEIE